MHVREARHQVPASPFDDVSAGGYGNTANTLDAVATHDDVGVRDLLDQTFMNVEGVYVTGPFPSTGPLRESSIAQAPAKPAGPRQ